MNRNKVDLTLKNNNRSTNELMLTTYLTLQNLKIELKHIAKLVEKHFFI